MPRRPLGQAREILEANIVPRLNDWQATQYREWLDRAENAARAQADSFAAEREAEVRETRDAALRELTAVRDGFDDLRAEGGTGRVSAAAYGERLHVLRERQERAEAALRAAEEKVERIERIEEDPIAWFDDLTRRTPRLLPEVPW